MYSSFISGQIGLLLGLYLFISSSDKTISHFLLIAGLISTIIACYLYVVTDKNSVPRQS
jgi:hypothetical protein